MVPFLLNSAAVKKSKDEHEDPEKHDDNEGMLSYPLTSMINIILFDEPEHVKERAEDAKKTEI